MANDPNRDLLPVKDIDERSTRGAGVNCRADHNLVSKLKRSELEDRYMRLYDENTQIKKQLNCQDEKIKRLGTKVLRLIDEKKHCPDSCRRRRDSKGLEEFHMRIIELEHENYTLKDRNVVLRQQLANHARQHVAAHRSPNRSVHTSPRISHRQSSAPNINESNYMLSSRNQAQDVQLREAEEHINGLNEEIKSLHEKIDILQQDLEKTSLENQKTKVCENIELIRLQRSLKQQSIQIASLQAHVKNSEKNQKLLRDELTTAHKENEESLQVISAKQKEILDLYTKLEESKLSRLEQEELKERIVDLTSERDALRERGEFLMKTIEAKSVEGDIVDDLKKMLETEKAKKEELKQSLENTQKLLQSLKDSRKIYSSEDIPTRNEEDNKVVKTLSTVSTQTTPMKRRSLVSGKGNETDLELLASTQLFSAPDVRVSEKSIMRGSSRSVGTTMDISTFFFGIKSGESSTQTLLEDFPVQAESVGESRTDTKAFEAEKLNLERELEYVKQMLRSQTQRCELQDEEIARLKSDLRISEEKYSDTLRRLDLHLKIFKHLESRANRRFDDDTDSDAFERKYMSLLAGFEENSDKSEKDNVVPRVIYENEEKHRPSDEVPMKEKSVSSSFLATDSEYLDSQEKSQSERNGRWRFMQRKYLDSSGDEEDDGDDFEKDKTLLPSKRSSEVETPVPQTKRLTSKKEGYKVTSEKNRKNSDSSDSLQPLDYSSLKAPVSLNEEVAGETRPVPKLRTVKSKGNAEASGAVEVRSPRNRSKGGGNITICIEWLKLEHGTSLWYNDAVTLLFIDFSFLDVRGEETETPSSLKKPKKPVEKCYYNFTKTVEVTEFRASALQSLMTKPEKEILVFKVVSEPEESAEDAECLDVGIAVITMKQFLESNPSASLLLEVKNIVDMKELIGILSVRLDVSAIK